MEKQAKLRAALYIRVSTEEQAQDGLSAHAQAETLKQYCNAFDIEVADIYSDLGLSGKSLKERKELKRLIEDCGKGSFDLVLVWKISRLSRNLKDLLYLIDIFERNNVHFASCSEKFDTSTPVGRMTLQLLGSIAEFERNTIVENVKLGLKEFARKGGKATSLLGYDNIDKKLMINEREAGIVKLIFSLYTIEGMNYSAIAQYLNSMGYKTKRGSDFRGDSIAYVLHNPAYIGINRHRIDTEKEYNIDGVHPAIIDAEVWDRAQSIKPRFVKKTAREADTYAAPSKVICMNCSAPLKVFYAYSKSKKYKYLRCSSCSNYINVEKLEKAVIKIIIALIDNKDERDTLYSLLNPALLNEPISMELSCIESEIKRLEKSKARYLGLFENYKLSDTTVFLDRIAEIETQVKALTKKRLRLSRAAVSKQQPDYDSYFDSLSERLEAAEPCAVREVFASLINRIEVYKDEIKIVLYL